MMNMDLSQKPSVMSVKMKKKARKSGPRCNAVQLAQMKYMEENLRVRIIAAKQNISDETPEGKPCTRTVFDLPQNKPETKDPTSSLYKNFEEGEVSEAVDNMRLLDLTANVANVESLQVVPECIENFKLESLPFSTGLSTPVDRTLLSPSSTVSTFETVRTVSINHEARKSQSDSPCPHSSLKTVPFVLSMVAESCVGETHSSPNHFDKGLSDAIQNNDVRVGTRHDSADRPAAQSCVRETYSSPNHLDDAASEAIENNDERVVPRHDSADRPEANPPSPSSMVIQEPCSPPPMQFQRKLFAHLHAESPERQLFSHLCAKPPERKLFSHLRNGSPERNVSSYSQAYSPASPTSSDDEGTQINTFHRSRIAACKRAQDITKQKQDDANSGKLDLSIKITVNRSPRSPMVDSCDEDGRLQTGCDIKSTQDNERSHLDGGGEPTELIKQDGVVPLDRACSASPERNVKNSAVKASNATKNPSRDPRIISRSSTLSFLTRAKEVDANREPPQENAESNATQRGMLEQSSMQTSIGNLISKNSYLQGPNPPISDPLNNYLNFNMQDTYRANPMNYVNSCSGQFDPYSGVATHFHMCDNQGIVYGFYTGYDVLGHLTAYPDPAFPYPNTGPSELKYCDGLGNILQEQSGPPRNSTSWNLPVSNVCSSFETQSNGHVPDNNRVTSTQSNSHVPDNNRVTSTQSNSHVPDNNRVKSTQSNSHVPDNSVKSTQSNSRVPVPDNNRVKSTQSNPTHSETLSTTVKNIIASMKSVSKMNGVPFGSKDKTGNRDTVDESNCSSSIGTLETDSFGETTANSGTPEVVPNTSTNIASTSTKDNEIQRHSVLGRIHSQNSDTADLGWATTTKHGTTFNPKTIKCHSVDSKPKDNSARNTYEKHRSQMHFPGDGQKTMDSSLPCLKANRPPNPLESVQNKILNQIDSTAKTLAKASVDQRAKHNNEHCSKKSYKIPKRLNSSEAPKHRTDGRTAVEPIVPSKRELTVVEKRLLEEERLQQKKLVEVRQEHAKFLAAKIEKNKRKNPGLEPPLLPDDKDVRTAPKCKAAGAKMKVTLDFQQLFGDSISYQDSANRKDAKEKKSRAGGHSKLSHGSEKQGKAATIVARRGSIQSTSSVDSQRKSTDAAKRHRDSHSVSSSDSRCSVGSKSKKKGQTCADKNISKAVGSKASPITLDDDTCKSGSSHGDKKAGLIHRQRSSNSTSSVSSVKSSRSQSSSKSHRSESSDSNHVGSTHNKHSHAVKAKHRHNSESSSVNIASSTHKSKHTHHGDTGSHAEKVKHRHSSGLQETHSSQSSKHKTKEGHHHSSHANHQHKPHHERERSCHPSHTAKVSNEKVDGHEKKKEVPGTGVKSGTTAKPPCSEMTKAKKIGKDTKDKAHASWASSMKKLEHKLNKVRSAVTEQKSISMVLPMVKTIGEQNLLAKLSRHEKTFDIEPLHNEPVVFDKYSNLMLGLISDQKTLEETNAYKLHEEMTNCTVRICKMPALKTPVRISPEVVKKCSPCYEDKYRGILISNVGNELVDSKDVKSNVSRDEAVMGKESNLKDLVLQKVSKPQVRPSSDDSSDNVPLVMLKKKEATISKNDCQHESVGTAESKLATDAKTVSGHSSARARLSSGDDSVDDLPLTLRLMMMTPKKKKKRVKKGKPISNKSAPDVEKHAKMCRPTDSKTSGDKQMKKKKCKSDSVSSDIGPIGNAEEVGLGHATDAKTKDLGKESRNATEKESQRKAKEKLSVRVVAKEVKPEVSDQVITLSADQVVEGRDNVSASKDENLNIVNLEACGILMDEFEEPTEDIGVVITDSCLDTTGSSESGLEVACCMEVVSSEVKTEEKNVETEATDKMVPMNLSSEYLTPKEQVRMTNEGEGKVGVFVPRLEMDIQKGTSKRIERQCHMFLEDYEVVPENPASLDIQKCTSKRIEKQSHIFLEDYEVVLENPASLQQQMGEVVSRTVLDNSVQKLQEPDFGDPTLLGKSADGQMESDQHLFGSKAMENNNIYDHKDGHLDNLSGLLNKPGVEEQIGSEDFNGIEIDALKSSNMDVRFDTVIHGTIDEVLGKAKGANDLSLNPEVKSEVDLNSNSKDPMVMKDLNGNVIDKAMDSNQGNYDKNSDERIGLGSSESPSNSRDSVSVMNQTSNTMSSTLSEDRTILYGDSSYNFENMSAFETQHPRSKSPDNEDEEITRLFSPHKGEVHQLDSRSDPTLSADEVNSRSESTLTAEDFDVRVTPSSDCTTPSSRNSAEQLLDSDSHYLPDLKFVSPMMFQDNPSKELPKPRVVMTPRSFGAAVSSIIGSGKKTSMAALLKQSPCISAARKISKFYRTSSPAVKSTLMLKLNLPAKKGRGKPKLLKQDPDSKTVVRHDWRQAVQSLIDNKVKEVGSSEISTSTKDIENTAPCTVAEVTDQRNQKSDEGITKCDNPSQLIDEGEKMVVMKDDDKRADNPISKPFPSIATTKPVPSPDGPATSQTVNLHVRSVLRNGKIMVDIDDVQRSLPPFIAPFLGSLERYPAASGEVKNLQQLQPSKSDSNERGVDLVLYDDLRKALDDYAMMAHVKGNVLLKTEEFLSLGDMTGPDQHLPSYHATQEKTADLASSGQATPETLCSSSMLGNPRLGSTVSHSGHETVLPQGMVNMIHKQQDTGKASVKRKPVELKKELMKQQPLRKYVPLRPKSNTTVTSESQGIQVPTCKDGAGRVIHQIGNRSFTDDDLVLFRKRLNETLDEVVSDLRKKLCGKDSSNAQDIFSSSSLSMHQPLNVGNTSTAVTGQGKLKRKRRNSNTETCARTRKCPPEDIPDSVPITSSPSFQRDHMYESHFGSGNQARQVNARNEQPMDTESPNNDANTASESLKNKLDLPAACPELFTDKKIKLESLHDGHSNVPAYTSENEYATLKEEQRSSPTHPSRDDVLTTESVPPQIIDTVLTDAAKISGRRASEPAVSSPTVLSDRCASAPPCNSSDQVRPNGSKSRGSTERHFMQALFTLSKVEEEKIVEESRVEVKQEENSSDNVDEFQRRVAETLQGHGVNLNRQGDEQTDLTLADGRGNDLSSPPGGQSNAVKQVVEPSVSVSQILDMAEGNKKDNGVDYTVTFDKDNKERCLLLQNVEVVKSSSDHLSTEGETIDTREDVSVQKEQPTERTKDAAPEFDVSSRFDFTLNAEKVAYVMSMMEETLLDPDSSRELNLSGLSASSVLDTPVEIGIPASTPVKVTTDKQTVWSDEESPANISAEISRIDVPDASQKVDLVDAPFSMGDPGHDVPTETSSAYAEIPQLLNEKAVLVPVELSEPIPAIAAGDFEFASCSNDTDSNNANRQVTTQANTSVLSEVGTSSSKTSQDGLVIDTDCDTNNSTAGSEQILQQMNALDEPVPENVPEECPPDLQEALQSIEGLDEVDDGGTENDILSCACLEVGISAEDFDSCPEEAQSTAASLFLALDMIDEAARSKTHTPTQPSLVMPSVTEPEVTATREESAMNVSGFVNQNDSIGPVLHLPDPHLQQVAENQLNPPLAVKHPDTSTLELLANAIEEGSTSTSRQSPEKLLESPVIPKLRTDWKEQLNEVNKTPYTVEKMLQGTSDQPAMADDMPLDLSKKKVFREETVEPEHAKHSMFHQSAIDLTVKKSWPLPVQTWSSLAALCDHEKEKSPIIHANELRATASLFKTGEKGGLDNHGVNSSGSAAKRRRTMSNKAAIFAPHLNEVLSPLLPGPSTALNQNLSKQKDFLHGAMPFFPQQQLADTVMGVNVRPEVQTREGAIFPSPTATLQPYKPGSMMRDNHGPTQQMPSPGMSSFGMQPTSMPYTSPEANSALFHSLGYPKPYAQNSNHNRLLAQNYLDAMKHQGAQKTQAGSAAASGLPNQPSLPTQTLPLSGPQDGFSNQKNGSLLQEQSASINTRPNVSIGNGYFAAMHQNPGVRSRLREMIQTNATVPRPINSQSSGHLRSTDAVRQQGTPHAQGLSGRNEDHHASNLYASGLPPCSTSQLANKHQSSNMLGLHPELFQSRQPLQFAGQNPQQFNIQHRSPVPGWNAFSVPSLPVGYPHAYPYMYDVRTPINQSRPMEQRLFQHPSRSPNMSPQLRQTSPNLSRQRSPNLPGASHKGVRPTGTSEIGLPSLPTNLTIEGWSPQSVANIQGLNRQPSPNVANHLNQGKQMSDLGYGPLLQQSRMPMPSPSQITPPLEVPTVRHHVVAAQNYDLLHQDHPHGPPPINYPLAGSSMMHLRRGPFEPTPIEDLPKENLSLSGAANLNSYAPGNIPAHSNLSSLTSATQHAPTNVHQQSPSNGQHLARQVTSKINPVQLPNNSPKKSNQPKDILASNSNRPDVLLADTKTKPDSTATVSETGHGDEEDMLSLKRRLQAAEEARGETQSENERLRKMLEDLQKSKSPKKRKLHHEDGEDGDTGKHKRFRGQDIDGE